MIRILLQIVLPLLAPAALYVLWVYIKGRNPKADVTLQKGPLFWLILLGFVLAAASVIYFGLSQGAPRGGDYQPPRYEDGRVIPAKP